MAHSDIDNVLVLLRRIKSGDNIDAINIDIEKLEMELRFLRTFIKCRYVILPDQSLGKIRKKAILIVEMLHSVIDGIPYEYEANLLVEILVAQLLEFNEGNPGLRYNYELNDSYISEYMDGLGKNLSDICESQIIQEFHFLKQVKIIRKKMVLLRNLYATEIKGYVDHEKLEGLETRIQFMADNVGQFCLALWINAYRDDTDSDEVYGVSDFDYSDSDVVNYDPYSYDVSDDADSIEDYDDADSEKVNDGANFDEVNDYADTFEVNDDADSDEVNDDVDYNEVNDDADSDEVYDDVDSNEVNDDAESVEVNDDIVESNKDEDDTNDGMLSIPPYLLALIVLVQLEMQKIFLIELEASKCSQSRTFKNKKLPKYFSHHLHGLLVYLRNKLLEKFPNNVSDRNIDVAIEFLLVFLVDVPNHVIKGKMLNPILEKVGALVGDVLCVILKFLPEYMFKDETSKISLSSIQILEKLENLTAQVEEYYKSFEFTPSQFLTIGGLGFLDSLLRKLNEMLKSESGLNFMMHPQVSILERELSSLTFIFRDIAKVQHEHEILEDLKKRTVNLAYAAEVAIDSILVQYNSLWHLFCSLPTIMKETKDISAEVTKLRFKKFALMACSVVKHSEHLPTQHKNHEDDEDIVGFENEAEKIIQYLLQGTNELDVIPIVGMGGQGKTTIARKVYNNERVVSHFDGLAWCCVSQMYDRIELLREIYSQFSESKQVVKDDEIADVLKKCLTRRRYLIVLDDVWDVKAWEDLGLSFPQGEERSRIIVTTRLKGVGMQVKHHTDPYSLPFLTPGECSELLQKKVFQKESYPLELQGVSLAIADKCKGLPLVVILVAGILKKYKMEESWWRKVGNALYSYLDKSEEYSVSTMQLSYDNLPDHLRPCLLYMGMFPEDARIPVSELISLWVAEGFVESNESGRLEEAAEGYLMDLISSNVVMVSRRRYNRKVKYCQVHDVVLHFCLKRSVKEKFMLAAKGHYSQFQTSEWNRLSFNLTDTYSKVALSGSKTLKPFNIPLRSLKATNPRPFSNWEPFHQVSELRLLKVLDLSSFYVRALSSAMLLPLIHLKYLAASVDEFNFHPESHLRHLETIIVKVFLDVLLPENFWKMEKLRHVEITHANFDLENYKQRIIEESFKLENLRILGHVEFLIRDVDSMDVLLGRCPNLQELEITISKDDEEDCTTSLQLESFTHLQSLELQFKGRNIIVSELHMPSNLKKLKLCAPHVVSMASLIAGLPSLEYLQLSDLNSKGDEWCLGGITFNKLKFLKLVQLRISRWDASEESFPVLETLVIRSCPYLEEIPLGFVDIQTLKQIKLVRSRMTESLQDSAVKIKEEVEAIEGCDRVDLIIRACRNISFIYLFYYRRASNMQEIC